MDFELSERQKQLQQRMRELFSQENTVALTREMMRSAPISSGQLWQKLAQEGVLGMPFPKSYGGGDGSFLDLAIALEEMGRALVPGPFLVTVVLGGLPVLWFGSPQQRAALLPKLCRGELVLTAGLLEESGTYTFTDIKTTAVRRGNGFVLKGMKLLVPYAGVSDHLLCPATVGKDCALFLVDTRLRGIEMTPLKTFTGDKKYEVALRDVMVGEGALLGQPGDCQKQLERILQHAAVAQCAESVGAARRVLEMAVEYVKQRVQFGRPIGEFQAVQHHCANMAIDVETSQVITYEAAWKLSEGLPAAREVAMAKAYVSEAFRRVSLVGHQVHGGIGLLERHDMPLYSRRAKAAETAYGDALFHLERLAAEMEAHDIIWGG